jgi:hypothetical protein
MNRREFIQYTVIQSFIASCPTVSFIGTQIVVKPSGGDDTEAINAALKASAVTKYPALLGKGIFIISDTLFVPSGARLIGRGISSRVVFNGGKAGVVVRVDEPHKKNAITNLFVEDKRSLVPFIALIGNQA